MRILQVLSEMIFPVELLGSVALVKFVLEHQMPHPRIHTKLPFFNTTISTAAEKRRNRILRVYRLLRNEGGVGVGDDRIAGPDIAACME